MKHSSRSGALLKNNKTSIDAKIAATTLHLEYWFDKGFNLRDRIIQLTDEIVFPAFDFVDAALTELENESRKGVTIRLNSLGGSVYEALAIVGRINASPCKITIEGYGAIMSAATLILAAGDKRKLSHLAWFMHHEASVDAGEMRAAQLDAFTKQLKREEKQWAKAMAEYTNRDAKFWLTKGTHIDAYFDANELLKLGVIDEVF
jgi:ATP-dependent protease ClpP protease subunit